MELREFQKGLFEKKHGPMDTLRYLGVLLRFIVLEAKKHGYTLEEIASLSAEEISS